MWGARDSGVTLERSLLLLEAIPGAELHIFDGAAHWVQWDQADRFITIVRDFLTSGPPGAWPRARRLKVAA